MCHSRSSRHGYSTPSAVNLEGISRTSVVLKPGGNQKDRGLPNVGFDLIAMIDPRAGDPWKELLHGAELEVRTGMQRDALYAITPSERPASDSDPSNS